MRLPQAPPPAVPLRLAISITSRSPTKTEQQILQLNNKSHDRPTNLLPPDVLSMAKMKKAKQPKLTEEEKERIEQQFHQVRDQSLRKWYAQSQDKDPTVSAAAQARLQLQIWLREKREQIEKLKLEREACKASGDANGLAAVQKKRKKAAIGMSNHTKMAVEGIPPSTEAKACREWAKKTPTLDEMLGDRDLDRRTEFGVNRDSLLDITARGRGTDEDWIEAEFDYAEDENGGIQLGEQSTGSTPEITPEAGDLVDPVANNVWSRHALHMQERYQNENLPDHAIETKLALQKKLFDIHVDSEEQLRTVIMNTDRDPTLIILRQGIKTTHNPVLATTTFSEHSLWELTSPLLWRYYEGKDNWDAPGWVPSGTMRVHTTSGSAHIYFDFGSHTYSTQRVEVPASCSMRPVTVSARCDQTGEDVGVDITFLDRGFVAVDVPLSALVSSAVGLVGLAGVWLGPVE
jgi:hypothetical protein